MGMHVFDHSILALDEAPFEFHVPRDVAPARVDLDSQLMIQELLFRSTKDEQS